MPRRKRSSSNIGRSTKAARRKRLVIKNENKEQRKKRLAQMRQTASLYRARESLVEREIRLSLSRDRLRRQRANESCVEREIRLSLARDRQRMKRATKSLMERINLDRDRHRIQRALKSSVEPEVLSNTASAACQYCFIRKWKKKLKDVCSSQGEVKLEEILTTPEPSPSRLTE